MAPPMMSLPPNHEMAIMQPYMQNCMTGPFQTSSFSARTMASRTSSAEASNFSIS